MNKKPKYVINNGEPTMIPPFMIPNHLGKTYLMPGWIELPFGTKMKDITVEWVKYTVETPVVLGDIKVPRGRKYFTVSKRVEANEYLCNCSQYSWSKKTCPHIVIAKLKGL